MLTLFLRFLDETICHINFNLPVLSIVKIECLHSPLLIGVISIWILADLIARLLHVILNDEGGLRDIVLLLDLGEGERFVPLWSRWGWGSVHISNGLLVLDDLLHLLHLWTELDSVLFIDIS